MPTGYEEDEEGFVEGGIPLDRVSKKDHPPSRSESDMLPRRFG